MNYREVKVSERLPDEDGIYWVELPNKHITTRAYKCKNENLIAYFKIATFWLEAYDPEAEAKKRIDNALKFIESKVTEDEFSIKNGMFISKPFRKWFKINISKALRIASGLD